VCTCVDIRPYLEHTEMAMTRYPSNKLSYKIPVGSEPISVLHLGSFTSLGQSLLQDKIWQISVEFYRTSDDKISVSVPVPSNLAFERSYLRPQVPLTGFRLSYIQFRSPHSLLVFHSIAMRLPLVTSSFEEPLPSILLASKL
jgi:hypothetical protein